MATTVGQSYFSRLTQTPPPVPEEVMIFELARLQSFSQWMSYDRASPISLAKAGFVYTGIDDVVKCFVCHISKGGWSRNMNPLVAHRDLNSECTFCLGDNRVNVPILVPKEAEYREIIETLHRQYCGNETTVLESLSRARDNFSNSSYNHHQSTETQTNFPVVAADAGTAETSRQAIGVRGAFGRGHDYEAAPTREEFAPMKQESNRFASFDASWPREDTPDPRDLARAGFYYTGTVDRVQCAFCRGILRNWDEDDVPMDEHRTHFPMCPYVLGLDVGNIPDPTAIIAANRTEDFLSVTQQSAVVSDASLGIVTERPKHAQYAVEAARITSFRNWPRGKEQTPQMLAKAGFFYAGFGDSVKCFFCGGGLRTWDLGDVPWTEHARWYPHCPYVRQVKGEEFIQAAVQGQEPSESQSAVSVHAARNTTERMQDSTTRTRCIVDPRELSARMDSPMVQRVLNLDIPRKKVIKAIKNRLEDTGDDFPSVQALLDAIFQISEEVPPPGETQASSSSGYATGSHNDGDPTQCKEALSLVKENEELKEQRRCKICMSAEVSVVFLPCGHLVCCSSCAPNLPKCPICRCGIRGTVRTYMS